MCAWSAGTHAASDTSLATAAPPDTVNHVMTTTAVANMTRSNFMTRSLSYCIADCVYPMVRVIRPYWSTKPSVRSDTPKEEINMRDVVLLHWLSLDGVSEEPSDWFFNDGPELFDLIGRVLATQDDVLLGRGSYDYWAGYWPTSDVEPFATFINSTHKHVATSSALTQPWNNTSVMTKPPTDYVRDLKQQPGGDIGIHASTELAPR